MPQMLECKQVSKRLSTEIKNQGALEGGSPGVG